MKIKYNNELFDIKNIKEMKGFQKFLGLMFSKGSQALLFNFNKQTKQPIHSFFCPKFLAIWLDSNNNVLEIKPIYNSRFSIKPKQRFSKLLEIPLNNKYIPVVKSLLNKKSL